MLRLLLALAIVLTSPATSLPAEHRGDRGRNGEMSGQSEAGGRYSLDHLHDRIDRAEGVGEADKERLHGRVNAIEAQMDAVHSSLERIQKANSLVDSLQAEGLIPNDTAEKAKIESEVRKRLDRIEDGRSTFEETRRNLEAEIEASKDLTREQKNEVRSIFRNFAAKRITEAQARLALGRLLGDGGGDGEGFVLITVLFILLVLIGAGFSDRRLKRDVRLLATRADGLRIYAFRYLWSDTEYVGVMAQDLLADPRWRDAAKMTLVGFYVVDYARLGLRMTTLDAWRTDGLDAVVLRTAAEQAAELAAGS